MQASFDHEEFAACLTLQVESLRECLDFAQGKTQHIPKVMYTASHRLYNPCLESIGLSQEDRIYVAREGVGSYIASLWKSIVNLVKRIGVWLASRVLGLPIGVGPGGNKMLDHLAFFEKKLAVVDKNKKAIIDKMASLSTRHKPESDDAHAIQMYKISQSRQVEISKHDAGYLWGKLHKNLTPWEEAKRSIEVSQRVSGQITETIKKLSPTINSLDFSRRDQEYWQALGSIKNDTDENGTLASHIVDLAKDFKPEKKGTSTVYVYSPPTGLHCLIFEVSSSKLVVRKGPHGQDYADMVKDLAAANNGLADIEVRLMTIDELVKFAEFAKSFKSWAEKVVEERKPITTTLQGLITKIENAKDPAGWSADTLGYVRQVIGLYQFFIHAMDEDAIAGHTSVALLSQAMKSVEFYYALQHI